MLRGHASVQRVKPQAVIERQALEGPLILNVEPEIRLHSVLCEIRCRILRDAVRDAGQECVVHIAVDDLVLIVDALLHLNPSLEGMGPGDVGHRKPLGGAELVGDIGVELLRVVLEVGRQLEDVDIVRVHAHEAVARAWIGPTVFRERPAGFEQELAGPHRVQGDLKQPLG